MLQLGRRGVEQKLQEVCLPLAQRVPGLQPENALPLLGSLTMQWALSLQTDPQPPQRPHHNSLHLKELLLHQASSV